MSGVARAVGPGLWADTSEPLILSQYQALALRGFRGAIRYVPLASQSPTAPGVIQLGELQAALSVKCPDGTGFGMMFVQFSRSSGLGATSGQEDGAAAAEYVQKLGVPPTVNVYQDLDVGAKADCIAYSNAHYEASIAKYLAAAAPGAYCEPGYPLTASERYQLLYLHRYWATAAADPNRIVTPRGCQILQLWESSRGEYSPVPGVEIDADAIQLDWFGDGPVGMYAA